GKIKPRGNKTRQENIFTNRAGGKSGQNCDDRLALPCHRRRSVACSKAPRNARERRSKEDANSSAAPASRSQTRWTRPPKARPRRPRAFSLIVSARSFELRSVILGPQSAFIDPLVPSFPLQNS